MRLSVFVGVLAVGSGIAMGKLLHDREVAPSQAASPAPSADPGKPSPPPARSPRPVGPGPKASPGPAALPPLTAQELATLEEPKRSLAAGRFDEARLATFATDPRASASLQAAMKVLKERATLYASLTSAIHRHPFANAPDLVEVTLPNNVTYTARVLTETDEMLSLALADGRQIDVHQERVMKRVRLTADEWMARKRGELEKEVSDLGDAGSLEIFHVAFEAFEAGFSTLGVPLLERALSLPGGGAVVDVYGTGDIELLHRAQERLRADLGNPNGGGVEIAQGRRTKPPRVASSPSPVAVTPGASPQPGATPVAAASPEPEPEPEPEASTGPSGMDRLLHDPNWSQANATYTKAVAIYRDSFAGSTPEQKAGIREAQKLLEQAQALLDKLPQDMGDANATIDTIVAKVNSLLRDVKKRKMATGS